MSRVLPANVWLSTLSLTAPDGREPRRRNDHSLRRHGAGAQPAPTAVSIDGYTYTQPDVARLLARLATLPSLSA